MKNELFTISTKVELLDKYWSGSEPIVVIESIYRDPITTQKFVSQQHMTVRESLTQELLEMIMTNHAKEIKKLIKSMSDNKDFGTYEQQQ